jgi:hypothetical protein
MGLRKVDLLPSQQSFYIFLSTLLRMKTDGVPRDEEVMLCFFNLLSRNLYGLKRLAHRGPFLLEELGREACRFDFGCALTLQVS